MIICGIPRLSRAQLFSRSREQPPAQVGESQKVLESFPQKDAIWGTSNIFEQVKRFKLGREFGFELMITL